MIAYDASCRDHTGAQVWTVVLPLFCPRPLACVGLEPGCMLAMLSGDANGQQDNKKIDELISIIQSARLARKEQILGTQPCRLARRFQRWGRANGLSGKMLQRSPCSPRCISPWPSDR
jgi:hypothetical protein